MKTESSTYRRSASFNLAIASTALYLAHETDCICVCLSQRESWRERERERRNDFIVHTLHSRDSSSLTKRIFLSREASLKRFGIVYCVPWAFDDVSSKSTVHFCIFFCYSPEVVNIIITRVI